MGFFQLSGHWATHLYHFSQHSWGVHNFNIEEGIMRLQLKKKNTNRSFNSNPLIRKPDFIWLYDCLLILAYIRLIAYWIVIHLTEALNITNCSFKCKWNNLYGTCQLFQSVSEKSLWMPFIECTALYIYKCTLHCAGRN